MQVIFIHSSDTDGRAFVGRFQTTSQNQGEDIEKKVQVCQYLLYIYIYYINLRKIENIIGYL